MLFTQITVVASALFLQLVSATPVPTATDELWDRSCGCPKKPTGATPTMPTTGDATELPTTNHTLAYVTVGRGIQNYTCTANGSAATQLGALATLFDATPLAYASTAALNAVPPMAVYVPLPNPGTSFNYASTVLPVIGHHYFDAAGTPSFELTAVNKALYAGKTGDIKAPATSNKGPQGTGAVDWLFLTAKPAPYASVGLSQVYRIVTAGGVAPACTAAGVVSVQYAAEYWFYQ